jgi:hypothetical protein
MLKDGAKPVAHLAGRAQPRDRHQGARVFLGDPVIEHGGEFYISRATSRPPAAAPAARPLRAAPAPAARHRDRCRPRRHRPRHGEPEARHDGEDLHARRRAEAAALLEKAGYKVMMIRETDVTSRRRTARRSRTSGRRPLRQHPLQLALPEHQDDGRRGHVFPPGPALDRFLEPGQEGRLRAGGPPINAFAAWNTVLAGALHRRLLDALHSGDRGEKFEHLAVLRGLVPGRPRRAGVPLERRRGRPPRDPAYRDTIAGAIFAGIQDYADEIRRLHPIAGGRRRRPQGPAPGGARRPTARFAARPPPGHEPPAARQPRTGAPLPQAGHLPGREGSRTSDRPRPPRLHPDRPDQRLRADARPHPAQPGRRATARAGSCATCTARGAGGLGPEERTAFEHHLPSTDILVAFPLEAWPHLQAAMRARTKERSAWSGA